MAGSNVPARSRGTSTATGGPVSELLGERIGKQHLTYAQGASAEAVAAGPDVEVLAVVDEAVVAVRQGTLLATSFHPEVGGDHRVHDVFVSMVTRRA